ncbi:phage minor capsid protein [Paenibacillus sp. HWE-109]|uniref:phage minor capsid protein n=1 Tax=Paenibacillus sp. HWE-109 TaxID=1306526 RepID=UPI001EDF79EC|nr:phage minor capsid protein [Paenibacillus sp. HWE-109]UKS30166.1 phage minor capsid protein [Paenibacillus sp. HWE-109]
MSDPTYESEIAEITAAFRSATQEIRDELSRVDIVDLSYPKARPHLVRISTILADLFAKVSDMVARLFSKAASDGIQRAMDALGTPGKPSISRINSNMLVAVTEDTQADLLAVTQNIDRRTKVAVRRAVAESMRGNMTAGINGRKTISRDILARIKKTLAEPTSNGIVDAAGRRWKPEVYAEVVTRTKAMYAHMETTTNEALERGVLYGRISRHGATDGCAKYEGKIVKLTPDAPGDYPYVGDLRASGAIFHPNCRHVITPVRNPDKAVGGG